ncbi:TetR/AcrR family transcriptional regulator [Hahella sp. SMD15-11]|uniref:TetR/AcrR family transcriptional regulator n=1 Tax=Thermohahella caldifontis TaxID=3142973 RepID=A0AB39UTR5_9GAMM
MVFCKREPRRDDACPIRRFKKNGRVDVAEREAHLLDIAEQVVEQHGFAGLTMDKIVSRCAYSKGTVYNHFSSKEDLISALCIRAMRTEMGYLNRALTFDGCTRERALAGHFAYQLYARLHPTLFLCVLSAKTPAVTEKTSPARMVQMQELEQDILSLSTSLMQAAIAAGDLTVPDGISPQQLMFAHWATAFGTSALLSAEASSNLKELDREQASLFNINLLLDGMGWRPLSGEHDYRAVWYRIGQTLFKQELETLNSPQHAQEDAR